MLTLAGHSRATMSWSGAVAPTAMAPPLQQPRSLLATCGSGQAASMGAPSGPVATSMPPFEDAAWLGGEGRASSDGQAREPSTRAGVQTRACVEGTSQAGLHTSAGSTVAGPVTDTDSRPCTQQVLGT